VHKWIADSGEGMGEEAYSQSFEDTKKRQQQMFQQARIEQEKKSFNVAFKVLHSKSAKARLFGFDVSKLALGQLQIGKLHNMVDKVQTPNLQLLRKGAT
jgi:hypothetical protein